MSSRNEGTVTFDSVDSSLKSKKTQNPAFDGWEVGSRYQVSDMLGKGSYGHVAKARDMKGGRQVAIKQMKRIFDEPTDAKRAYREMHILRHLQHPTVVALLDVMATSIDQKYIEAFDVAMAQSKIPLPKHLGNLYLVFEFVDTDLSKIIKSPQYLSGEHIQYILYQLLDGLKYVHLTHVIHRDLKPANVLVSCSDCTIKIADFGLSRVVGADLITAQSPVNESNQMDDEQDEPDFSSDLESGKSLSEALAQSLSQSLNHLVPPPAPLPSIPSRVLDLPAMNPLPAPVPLRRGLTRHVVTRWYRAPEVILLQPYTAAVDIWSVGCIFAELLNLMQESRIDYRSRRALFPGESCGELSADDLMHLHSMSDNAEAMAQYQQQLQESYANNRSQLNIIFDMIGTPTESDLAHLDTTTSSVLRGLDKKAGKGFREKYPFADAAALDLLQCLLRFDPTKRITAAQALEHPFFNDIKLKGYLNSYQNNNQHLSSNGPIPLSIALNPVPMNADKEKIGESSEHLKVNIIKEVMYYRNMDRARP